MKRVKHLLRQTEMQGLPFFCVFTSIQLALFKQEYSGERCKTFYLLYCGLVIEYFHFIFDLLEPEF